MSATATHPEPDLIPPPAVLRERLARALREVELLRGLIRLTEKVNCHRKPVAHAPPDGGNRR